MVKFSSKDTLSKWDLTLVRRFRGFVVTNVGCSVDQAGLAFTDLPASLSPVLGLKVPFFGMGSHCMTLADL